ncbi:uncharacterized protein N7511_001536 [Penicillium nucicola]|uniref:uncharacterized protein n=1 Tax=Penicillium nucicola TaxID=1850975 RepID=UPI00254559A8|nr:uncharacterized protein N7511_001536 [Penicillium nucicola]KAJ5776525.1 hypothetical protein N7511_001536 [Penicillium nucicola]
MSDILKPAVHVNFRKSLQGQKVTIPSIYETFPEWKPQVHPEYKRARAEVLDPWIQKWVPNKRTVKGLQAADFGVFAAVWAPKASFDVLCTAAKYFAWYFVYDDIFDCGALKYDEPLANTYREASLQYFRFTLLGEGAAPDLSVFHIELQNALYCWDEVGHHIGQVCSRGTRQVLCGEMLRYVDSLNNVDSLFAVKEIPSIDEYWERREATAAAHCVTATIPFIYGIDIDEADVQNQPMKDLWKHTSYFVHITNDMLSFRKEVDDDQIENLIPVLMLNSQIDCNTAMDQSYQLLHNEAKGFNSAKERLLEATDPKVIVIAEAFIEGCLNVAVGLAHWSYCGDRYFRPSDRQENNVISFTIGASHTQQHYHEESETLKASSKQSHLPPTPLQSMIYSVVPFAPLIMLSIVSIPSVIQQFGGPSSWGV